MDRQAGAKPGRSPGGDGGGLLIVNKPRGTTSRAVVDQVARLVPRVKAGHAGTLDPLASGVLIVCLGPATRLVELIQPMPKTYRTIVLLGARSDTLDADGRIMPQADPIVPSRRDIERAVSPLVGAVDQRPPNYSALKIRGRRAYDLARAGRTLDLAPRRVHIHRIDVLHYDWPRLELEIDCGGGTYIRAIARDVGETLGCGGLVETLVRTRIGPFTIDQAVDPRELSAESLPHLLRRPLEAVADLPRRVLDPDQAAAVAAGRKLLAPDLDRGDAGLATGPLALIDPQGRLIALAEFHPSEGSIQPRKVLGG
jgi:tRNA pseudouridine55 synthase